MDHRSTVIREKYEDLNYCITDRVTRCLGLFDTYTIENRFYHFADPLQTCFDLMTSSGPVLSLIHIQQDRNNVGQRF